MNNQINKKILFFLFCFCIPVQISCLREGGLLSFLPEKNSSQPYPSSNKNRLNNSAADSSYKENEHSLEESSIPAFVLPTPPEISTATERPDTEEEPEEPASFPKEPVKAKVLSATEKKEMEKARKEVEAEQKISFYFEDATLENVVKYIEKQFKVTFLPDDAVTPVLQGGGTLQGQKISFRTNKLFSRQEAWSIFLRILDLASLAVIPGPTKDFYRITSVTAANKEPLPTFIDSNLEKVPNNATKIRYIYFVKQNSLANIQNVIIALASTTAKIDSFPELNAIIMTDKATNIQSLMRIINEFDKAIPEAMSIIKLKKGNATEIAKFYADLVNLETAQDAGRYLAQRAQPASFFLPANVRVIPEPRNNLLILLGQKKNIETIEAFIAKNLDIEVDLPYSPLHYYVLKNMSAPNAAAILNQVLTFGNGTEGASYGGVRDGDQYFKSVSIVPEPSGNTLIIKANQNDYEKIEAALKILDVEQPQVAIEFAIIDVTTNKEKSLGAQLINSADGVPFKNVNFQSAMLGQPQTDTGTGSLLGNLLGLATGATNLAGTTLLSVGSAAGGIWGLLKILQTYTDTHIIQTPFVLATNNTQSSFVAGTTRRAITASVGATNSVGDVSANLDIKVTPQINSEGFILMNISITLADFSNPTISDDANRTNKTITTSAFIRDGEVLVIGGITKNNETKSKNAVPILSKLPIVGRFFEYRDDTVSTSNVLIFISAEILPTYTEGIMSDYTAEVVENMRDTIDNMNNNTERICPIDNAFFGVNKNLNQDFLADFDGFKNERENAKRKSVNSPTKEEKTTKKKKNTSRKKRLSRKRVSA